MKRTKRVQPPIVRMFEILSRGLAPTVLSGNKLALRSCDPSRHNTLRYDQVERRRKVRRKKAVRIRYDKQPPK